jgi:hypothetical protein
MFPKPETHWAKLEIATRRLGQAPADAPLHARSSRDAYNSQLRHLFSELGDTLAADATRRGMHEAEHALSFREGRGPLRHSSSNQLPALTISLKNLIPQNEKAFLELSAALASQHSMHGSFIVREDEDDQHRPSFTVHARSAEDLISGINAALVDKDFKIDPNKFALPLTNLIEGEGSYR